MSGADPVGDCAECRSWDRACDSHRRRGRLTVLGARLRARVELAAIWLLWR